MPNRKTQLNHSTENSAEKVGGINALYGAIVRSALEDILEANKPDFIMVKCGKQTKAYEQYLESIFFLKHMEKNYGIKALSAVKKYFSIMGERSMKKFIVFDLTAPATVIC